MNKNMNNNKLLIPGWRGTYDIKKLYTYKINFNRKNLEISTLNYYLKQGEYISDFPLGVFKSKNNFMILTNTQDISENKVIIKNSIGEIDLHNTFEPKFNQLAIESFFHTLMDIFYIDKGFEKPINTRTFLGKSAKGKLSDRCELIKEIKIPGKIFDSHLKVYNSVNHQIYISKNEFLITCLPNHEIYGNFLDLPLSNEQKRKLEDLEEYNSIIYINPDKISESRFFSKYQQYKNYISNRFEECDFISNIKEINLLNEKELKRCEEFIINPLNLKFVLNENDSFGKQIVEIFKENDKKLPNIPITILLDVYKIKDDSFTSNKIEKYLCKIKEANFFKVIEIIKFKEIEDIELVKQTNYFVILEDNSPGKNFIYDYIKKESDISKVIYYSTVKKIENYQENLLLMWLSFFYRLNKKLVWYKDKKIPFNRIISFNSYLDNDLNMLKISGFILNIDDYNAEKFSQVFFLPNNFKSNTKETIKALLRSLKFDFDIPNKQDFYLFSEGKYSQEFINNIKNISISALIAQPYSRIFQFNDKINIPQNGTFFKIFKTKSHYLLVTTGKPDYSGMGVPNPLFIKIFNNNNSDISDNQILQIIFDLTFYQTLSFAKTLLPFIITQNNKNLYTKIPLKYNEEVPF